MDVSEPSLAGMGWRLSWPRDRVVLVVLAVGVALRVLVTIAFRPGLELFGDSYSYLRNAHHLELYWFHPMGYPVFLRLLWWTHLTLVVAIVQHLLGVAVGLGIYLLVRRAGIRPAYAALAAAPVLLDAYQIDVEQFVLSDTLFLVLVVAAFALLLVPARPHPLVATGAGLALAAATLTRGVGGVLLVPLGLYLLVRRVGWRPIVAFGAAATLPVLAYMTAFHARYHSYALETTDGLWLYGHTATFARCDLLPARERPLCPAQPIHARHSSEWYTWDLRAPLYRHDPPDRRPAAGRKFAIAVIEAQPLGYAKTTVVSLARDFSPVRSDASWAWPTDAWKMKPVMHPGRTNVELARNTLDGAMSRRVFPYPLSMHAAAGAGVLSAYQHVGYVWGPALGICLLLPVAAIASPRARRRRTTAAAISLAAAGGLLIVVPSLTVTQDYRYLLPAQALLVPAAVLAGSVLWPRSVRQPVANEQPTPAGQI
jgi:hypothetical protein